MSTLATNRIKRSKIAAVTTPHIAKTGLLLALFAVVAALFVVTIRPVHVTVDGMNDVVYTHRRTVEQLLLDLGLTLQPQDHVLPLPETRLTRDLQLTVERARPVRVLADGRDLTVSSWGETPAHVLADAGIAVDPFDQVQIQGIAYELNDPLPEIVQSTLVATYDRGYAWQGVAQAPLELRLQRSLPINIVDGGLPFTFRSTAQTVGQALRDASITLYLGDRVQPSLGSPVSTGQRITIERSTPITIQHGRARLKTRTQGRTVSDVLAELRISLAGLDRVAPPLETPLYDNINIVVTQVEEAVVVDEEIAEFETIFEPDGGLPIDTQQVVTPGAEGITRTRERIRYENGEEQSRIIEDTWLAQAPAQRVIAYGTGIEPKAFTTAAGETITYWRKIRMLASSYSAGTAGVSPDEPWYGRTYSGDPMRFGIVAVDPSIVPLRSQVYVPGYGLGDALDIGSAIRARRIDLGYDDDNLQLWSRWVDVYLLWPPPPDYQITWVLPNWPRPPD